MENGYSLLAITGMLQHTEVISQKLRKAGGLNCWCCISANIARFLLWTQMLTILFLLQGAGLRSHVHIFRSSCPRYLKNTRESELRQIYCECHSFHLSTIQQMT